MRFWSHGAPQQLINSSLSRDWIQLSHQAGREEIRSPLLVTNLSRDVTPSIAGTIGRRKEAFQYTRYKQRVHITARCCQLRPCGPGGVRQVAR
mmetsp:Transcript_46269/g.53609  ORF Transcript_46269/g.53609 Transcript_46269/m.53609 type:complete len:93 (+) Transcript_46269:637-915(+)